MQEKYALKHIAELRNTCTAVLAIQDTSNPSRYQTRGWITDLFEEAAFALNFKPHPPQA